jgi:hypothetical protein
LFPVDRGYFTKDRFFFFSLFSVLAMNAIAVSLTWLVVFSWKLGYEYNPSSLWQLSTYGPYPTLVITQLTLLGLFILVRNGMAYIARLRFDQLLRRTGSDPDLLAGIERAHRYSCIKSQFTRITRIVLLTIVVIIALDVLNDISGILVVMHVI